MSWILVLLKVFDDTFTMISQCVYVNTLKCLMSFFLSFYLQFSIGADGGINVDSTMQTSIADVYAAGDVCNASWEHAPHWLQVLTG